MLVEATRLHQVKGLQLGEYEFREPDTRRLKQNQEGWAEGETSLKINACGALKTAKFSFRDDSPDINRTLLYCRTANALVYAT